jgi:hypothetical protein
VQGVAIALRKALVAGRVLRRNPAPGPGNFRVPGAGAGGSPVTSRMSRSLRASRANKAERHPRLSYDRLCQQGLSGSWRADQPHALVARVARIGVGAGTTLDATTRSPEMKAAIEHGMADAWADVARGARTARRR